MTSTVSPSQIQEFLAQTAPFDRLGSGGLQTLASKCQLLRYRPGQPIFEREKMPTQVVIIYEGQARELGYDQRQQTLVSLRLALPGEIIGWAPLVRGIATETAIASTEVVAVTLPAKEFLAYLDNSRGFAQAFQERASVIEVFELLNAELQRRADGSTNVKELTLKLWPEAIAISLPKGKLDLTKLDPNRLWLVSSGAVENLQVGSRLSVQGASARNQKSPNGARLLGLPEFQMAPSQTTQANPQVAAAAPLAPTKPPDIPYAPPRPPAPPPDPDAPHPKFPFVRGRGKIDAPLACFQMLAKHFNTPFRKDLVRRVLENQLNTQGRLTLQSCGAVGAMMGLNGQLVTVPASAVGRLPAPAMIRWLDTYAILFSINEKELVLAIPDQGIVRKKTQTFGDFWGDGEPQQVLLLQKPANEETEKFSFWWFLPALLKYKGTLFQVFLTSLFLQLFGLANPILTQVIIDKVIGQKSIETLDVMGALMIAIALFEALLTGLRTYLFVDTTNRLDLSLGSAVIDHLLRLPLSYFDNRRVGELAGRVGELEKIRQFLTGTALTVVLDAFFSVFYIALMVSYSLVLTAVALATVPLFWLLILMVSPIVQRLLRMRAERYADAQSYLVEVLGGIQTVKAQNIELKSRWSWYERYARYINVGFKTVLTSSTAGSVSNFLNQVSSFLLLWAGAHMVLTNPPTLSLGELIAFRIVSGNVTGSLLRFVQVWQTFQETGMSIERLRDILEAKPEANENDRNNIPLPEIEGAVKFDGISFRFSSTGPLQLANVNLDFAAGQFVGLVGQSGSGKSTLMKLLQRLYEPSSGRILVDGYDINKVELYSLRRQIGVVLQDTLLFNGTVRENIALTNPEASDEEIIRAAKVAVAHDFIMTLTNGYNTVVGERGSSLSGGQRQRVAIARTVLQNPHMLILDEATSALDYNSERQVCQNLQKEFAGRTVFFITHRLQTVRPADLILMMDQGAVVELGKHDELMALKGRYYALYQQQESQV